MVNARAFLHRSLYYSSLIPCCNSIDDVTKNVHFYVTDLSPRRFTTIIKGIFFIQNCFICRPLDSTVMRDASIEPKTVAMFCVESQRL
jgi:hypothetical protein